MVVVVGVVRRHLLDTGGDGPHRLDVQLRGRGAPRPSPYLYPGAYVALPPVGTTYDFKSHLVT